MANADHLDQIRSYVDDVLARDGHDLESVKSSLSNRPGLEGVERVPGAPPRAR